MRAEARAHRVRFDIAVAGEHVLLGLHEAGSEASFPEAAAASVIAVDILSMQLRQPPHELRAAILFSGAEQQMNMISHQAIGMQAARRPSEQAPQMKQVKAAIVILVKARLAIIATVGDVNGHPRKHEARASRHARSTSEGWASLT